MITELVQGPYDPSGCIAVSNLDPNVSVLYHDIKISGVDVCVRSTGELHGLGLQRVSAYPNPGGVGAQITHAKSEGADFAPFVVVGGAVGVALDLPDEFNGQGQLLPPRPGWHFQPTFHADTSQYGIKLWHVAQVKVIGALIYKNGNGPYNGINTWRPAGRQGGTQDVTIESCQFVNNGARAQASAIVVGDGTDGVTICGDGRFYNFERAIWIQPGAVNVTIHADLLTVRSCDAWLLDQTGQAKVIGTPRIL